MSAEVTERDKAVAARVFSVCGSARYEDAHNFIAAYREKVCAEAVEADRKGGHDIPCDADDKCPWCLLSDSEAARAKAEAEALQSRTLSLRLGHAAILTRQLEAMTERAEAAESRLREAEAQRDDAIAAATLIHESTKIGLDFTAMMKQAAGDGAKPVRARLREIRAAADWMLTFTVEAHDCVGEDTCLACSKIAAYRRACEEGDRG